MSMTQQRTSEWFAQRKGKITGSIAGAILGLNPYMTPNAAMRRMVRDALGHWLWFEPGLAFMPIRMRLM